VAGEAGQPDQFEVLVDASHLLRLGHPVQLGEQLDVAADVAPLQKRRILEHIAETRPVDVDRARRLRLQPRGDTQQRRLPAAGRPDDRDELARCDVEIDAVQGFGPVGERHRHAVEAQSGRTVGHRGRCGG
jgi:hypothetical protein